METDQPAAVTAPAAVAPPIEAKLAEIEVELDVVVEKFSAVFGEPIPAL